MFKWLSQLTKKEKVNLRKRRRNIKSKVLDGIKEEILSVSEKLKSQSLCVEDNSAAIEDLQKQVACVSTSVLKLSATLERTQAAPAPTSPTLLPTPVTEEFTHQQEATLIILWKLIERDNSQWVPMKTLVKTIYPDQDYNRVRTTIFEYVRIFEELGMIQRIKRGNRTYITLTKKGADTVKKKVAGRKEKLALLPEVEA